MSYTFPNPHDQADFLDSHAPYDGEICTDAPWPLPQERKWTPAPLSWWQRLREKLIGGVAH